MKLALQNLCRPRRRSRALTLLEIMVTITLMTVIVLGLYAMFDQTQNALREGTTQVDVLENSRAVAEIQLREFEQARATGLAGATNFWIDFSPTAVPMTNVLIDGSVRTTAMHQVFFLTRKADWRAIAYIVGFPPSGRVEDAVLFTNGVGALYRFETNAGPLDVELQGTNLFLAYTACRDDPVCASNNFHLVAQGVVSFSVSAFNSSGALLCTNLPCAFTNAELPAWLEVELGVLEPHVLEQARALAFTNNPGLSRSFLTNQTGRLHMFRQRIPIRAQL